MDPHSDSNLTLSFFRSKKQRVLFLLVFSQVIEADERQPGGLRSSARATPSPGRPLP